MVELAIFEKNKDKKIFPVNRYFKEDYIGEQVFRSFSSCTFCYLLMLLLRILYRLDVLLDGMGIEESLRYGKSWDILCAGGLAFYLFVTWIAYSRRYDFVSRSQTMYAPKLRYLVKKYENKDRTNRTEDNRGGRIR